MVITKLFGWPWLSRFLPLRFLTCWVFTAVLVQCLSLFCFWLCVCHSMMKAAGGWLDPGPTRVFLLVCNRVRVVLVLRWEVEGVCSQRNVA